MATTAIETAITVLFDEQDGSPQEEYAESGLTVNRVLKCAWSARALLAEQLLGHVEDRGGGALVYVNPHRYAGGPPDF